MVIFLICPLLTEAEKQETSSLWFVVRAQIPSWRFYPHDQITHLQHYHIGDEGLNVGILGEAQIFSPLHNSSPERDRILVQWLICTYVFSLGLISGSNSFPPSILQVASSFFAFVAREIWLHFGEAIPHVLWSQTSWIKLPAPLFTSCL